MIRMDLGFNRQSSFISTYSSIRESDIKRMKQRYALSQEIVGTPMDHYVIVGGETFNGFGLKEAKKILGVK